MKRIALVLVLMTTAVAAQIRVGSGGTVRVQSAGAGGSGVVAKTCSGTDKFSSVDGGGNFTCSTDQSSGDASTLQGHGASYFQTAIGYTPFNNANFTLANVVGLWSSCSSGYLKFDGTCSTPAGGSATPAGSSGDLQTNNGSGALGSIAQSLFAKYADSTPHFTGTNPVQSDAGFQSNCTGDCGYEQTANTATTPTVSGAGNFRIIVKTNTPQISVNGAAYQNLLAGAAGSNLGLTKSGACASGYHADGTYNGDGTPHCSADTGGTGDTWVVAASTPAFSPVAGTYSSTQSVTASCAAGTAYCSTDGSTLAGSCSGISVAASTTLYARCEQAGKKPTNTTAAYTITAGGGTVATPTFGFGGGTYANDFNETIADGTSGASICYTTNGTSPTATTPGTCDQNTYSTAIAINTNGQQLRALGTKSGMTNSSVTANQTYAMQVATPTFSPAAGAVSNPTTVTASTTTTGATMYADQANPPTTASSTFSVTSAGTWYAQARKSNYSNSSVGSSAYTISGGASAPTYVASAPCGSGSNASSYTCAYTTVSSGQLLVVEAAQYSATGWSYSTPTAPCVSGGFQSATAGIQNVDRSVYTQWWYGWATSTGSCTVTVANTHSGTVNTHVIQLYTVDGANATTPIAATCNGQSNGNYNNPIQCSAAMTLTGNNLVMAFAMAGAGSYTWTAGTGFTLDAHWGGTSPCANSSDCYGAAEAGSISGNSQPSMTANNILFQTLMGFAIKP